MGDQKPSTAAGIKKAAKLFTIVVIWPAVCSMWLFISVQIRLKISYGWIVQVGTLVLGCSFVWMGRHLSDRFLAYWDEVAAGYGSVD